MKKKVRYLVDQDTNHGKVKAGDEPLVDAEIADLEVKRGIAEYVVEPTPSYKNWGIPRNAEKPIPTKNKNDSTTKEVESKKGYVGGGTVEPGAYTLHDGEVYIPKPENDKDKKDTAIEIESDGFPKGPPPETEPIEAPSSIVESKPTTHRKKSRRKKYTSKKRST